MPSEPECPESETRSSVGRRGFLGLLAGTAALGLVGCGLGSSGAGGSSAALTTAPSPTEPDAPNGSTPTRDWHISDKERAPASLLEAYAGQISVLPGEPVELHVSTAAKEWSVEAYRIGYYDGLGGALIASAGPFPGEKGGGPKSSTGGAMVADWPVGGEVETGDWPAGLYLLHVVADGRRTEVPVVVRSEGAADSVAVVMSATTWQAYNLWGDRSLYQGGDSAFEGRSYAVSFDRPYDERGRMVISAFEIPLVRVAEESGVRLSWFANTDIALDPALLDGAAAASSPGHDEYWPLPYRDALVKLRDSGGNLAFFGANAGYWRVRLSDPGTGPGRLVTCYKSASADPENGPETTARYRDQPFAAAENEVVGQLYDAYPVSGPMVIRDADFFLFGGTGVVDGSKLAGLVGPETDRVYALPSTPRPIQVPALSPVTCRGKQTWSTVAYYTTDSGAGVFSTGTMSWTRALPRPEPMRAISDAAKAFSHAVTLNAFRAIATPQLGRAHPATDELPDLRLPTTNTSGAA